MKNDKLFDLEIWNIKLKYTKINFIKVICGNPTLPFKMEIRLVYTEAEVYVKIQKIMSCKTKL